DVPQTQSWRGCLIANEVIDALPVRLFALREAGLFERCVGLDAQHSFVWHERAADAALAAAVTDVIGDAETLPRPYLSEVRPMLAPWFAEVAGQLQEGMAVFIDYGYSRAEYYSPQRRGGTLCCHYRHRAHDDPLILAGLQDITAWVDFDALAQITTDKGFDVVARGSQAEFLIAQG